MCDKKFRIHGYQLNPDLNNHLYIYGSDIQAIKTLMQSDPAMAEKLHPKYDYTVAEVVWAVREEMALNVEDILARRVRLLFLDARVAAEVAPKVARIVAKELGYDQAWIDGQVKRVYRFGRTLYFRVKRIFKSYSGFKGGKGFRS